MEAIGVILRQAREQQGLDLATIAAELRIRLKYLLELEESDADIIVFDVYKLGYAKLYANYLGVDIEPYLNVIEVTAQPEFHSVEMVNLEKTKPPFLIIATSLSCVIISVILFILLKDKQVEATEQAKVVVSHDAVQLFLQDDNKLYLENTAASKPLVAIGARKDVNIRLEDDKGKMLQEKKIKSGENFLLPSVDNLVIIIDAPNEVDFYEFSPVTMAKKKLEVIAR